MQFSEPNCWHRSHAWLTPEDGIPGSGLISLGWNAGTIHIQYVGLPELSRPAVDAISATIREFNSQCQLLAFMHAGVLGSQQAIQEQLGRNANRAGSFTLSGYYWEGKEQAIWARLPVGQVIDAFAENGEFERLYAKAFVVFSYHLWEEFARPRIAQELSVDREYVDEAESGRIADRPQFQKMLNEASKPEAPFQEILVWKFSRFTRKREHAVAFKAMLRRRGVRVVSITEQADDTPTGKLLEAIIESVDEFYSENLAQEVTRGMREAASRGFWVTSYAPYGYKRVYVQDGPKKRPTLELNPPADAVVRRIFDMALQGKSILDVTKTLNAEGIPTTNGKKWLKTTIHTMLANEAYTGAVVWGIKAKDKAEPVRVENAFPAIVSKREFQRAKKLLGSRAPKKVNPRWASSPYLLSGLLKCETCGKALTAAEAKSGKYTYYVCHSLLKRGSGTCKTPRLNAKTFEKLIVDEIRANILTESNIRDLVKLLDEEMDGVASEQRERLESIEEELEEVKRRLGRIWQVIETTDIEMADASERIREHRDRKEKLEVAAEEARRLLKDRRQFLDSADTIATFAEDMSEFLKTSELTQTRAFVHSFVKEIEVKPGKAAIVYSIPTPEDSPIGGADAAEVALNGRVRSSVRHGGPDWTKSRTEADSRITPSFGMGMVYVRTASSPVTSMPSTKLRMRALHSGNVPSRRKSRKSETYPLISSVVGSSTLRCSNFVSASSLAASSCSSWCLSEKMRGDRTSSVSSLLSRAS